MAPISPYTTYDPQVAAAMEASASCKIKVVSSIVGLMCLCWALLGAFFLYHFLKPLEEVGTEAAVGLPASGEGGEKRWWVDDYDAT
ncbi:hypothetical protein GGS23DRAFT_586433 [Durotheca rogersii]|uniref:uncharacterized protein n=1 Tax=Durotheca rogersii TaxID=419775 RepID=UPI00221E905B|nr:uncharacterized protein GGS23DRAFT_586433 [Durotheca rogersii]KAI5859282.1 hypothetical protein GGS23DRAFT_586433 [Durotheca rogersii]